MGEPNGKLIAEFPESKEKYDLRHLTAFEKIMELADTQFEGSILVVCINENSWDCLRDKGVFIDKQDDCGVSLIKSDGKGGMVLKLENFQVCNSKDEE